MKFILGTKQDMTQVFREDGSVVPVTRVKAGPCVVTQIKSKEKNGVDAVQVGFGKQKAFRLSKASQGHLKDFINNGITVRFLRDARVGDDSGLKKGDEFGVGIFETGEKVQVTGMAKGRGFQGVVKRHGFHGSPASHGHKDQLRMPGSIGATDPARVFKGTRMGGHMGDNKVTVKNLEIVEINEPENELLIKGALPGARNGLLMISTPEGKIEIKEPEKEPEVGELTDKSVDASNSKKESKKEVSTEEDKEQAKPESGDNIHQEEKVDKQEKKVEEKKPESSEDKKEDK